MERSTSQRSWRQNLAQGEASVASGTLGNGEVFHRALGRIAAGYAGSLSITSLVAACLVLGSLTLACSGRTSTSVSPPSAAATSATTTENYPNLATQAKEVSDALARKDFARFTDLTYPKVIEMLGGRERMVTTMTQQLKEMEVEGVTLVSSTSGTSTQFVHDAGSIYAVLPMTLTIKARDGIFQAESSMIGVSSDGGANWTFIDASGKDQNELKSLLPNVADRLSLPPEKKPVKISSNG